MNGWTIDHFGTLRHDESGALVIEGFRFAHPEECGLPLVDEALVAIADHLRRYATRLRSAAAAEHLELMSRLQGS
ncbi:hypothetical protein [Chitinasiproducens palmae]|uniref:Uncharacterized protein n=1 Tax=Chitinasiproducens palmae TaxID=1770053 RepID=A0A1H2PTM1_9BURK|nr:hypothetical protein [Chitinasiproducens palmae]SDV50467.1 hypothetical protein SAMN05216551_1123 [Chitinasiproducens palmae]